MRKVSRLIVLLLAIALCQLGCAQRWTAESAREEAFRDIQRQIDVSRYPSRDPDFEENQRGLREGNPIVQDRFVTPTGEESLGYVVSKMDKDGMQRNTMFYKNDGQLMSIRLFSRRQYPRAAYIYCADQTCVNGGEKFQRGELMTVTFHISGREVFYFHPGGRLKAHLKN